MMHFTKRFVVVVMSIALAVSLTGCDNPIKKSLQKKRTRKLLQKLLIKLKTKLILPLFQLLKFLMIHRYKALYQRNMMKLAVVMQIHIKRLKSLCQIISIFTITTKSLIRNYVKYLIALTQIPQ